MSAHKRLGIFSTVVGMDRAPVLQVRQEWRYIAQEANELLTYCAGLAISVPPQC